MDNFTLEAIQVKIKSTQNHEGIIAAIRRL